MAKSISQLNTIAQAHDSDLFEVAAVDAQSSSGYTSGKMTSEVLAEGMLSTFTYPTAMPDMQNKTITGALNQLLANFAAVYDDTATYSVGDICTYNGQLYKANQDISVAEAWDSTHWTAIVVKQISGANQHNYSTTEQVVGTWIDGKPLYEKTFVPNYTSPSHSASTTYEQTIDIHDLQIDTVVDLKGIWRRWAGDGAKLLYTFNSNEENYAYSRLRVDSENNYTNGRLVFTITSEGTDYQAITIQYTKTTD